MPITEQEVREKLRERLRDTTQARLAREWGVSWGYLNDVLHGRRSIASKFILKKLGYKKVTVIEKRA